MNLSTIFSISRPKFWFYLAGPYLVGYMFGSQNVYVLTDPYFIIHFLYFLIPANIILYGINDYFDEDTDFFNNKKGTYEHRLVNQEKHTLIGVLLFCLAVSFFILALQIKNGAQLLLSLFLFLSYFYSALPLRFKARPIVDFSSNFLYAIPGLVGYYQVTSLLPSNLILLAIFCWTSAMHLFSAIPDISADKKANLSTSAVVFGKKLSILVCLLLWLVTAVITIFSISSYLSLLVLVYPIIPLVLLLDPKKEINKIYWYFPYINVLCGFVLFLLALK